jgi:hypothetical protein
LSPTSWLSHGQRGIQVGNQISAVFQTNRQPDQTRYDIALCYFFLTLYGRDGAGRMRDQSMDAAQADCLPDQLQVAQQLATGRPATLQIKADHAAKAARHPAKGQITLRMFRQPRIINLAHGRGRILVITGMNGHCLKARFGAGVIVVLWIHKTSHWRPARRPANLPIVTRCSHLSGRLFPAPSAQEVTLLHVLDRLLK